MRRWRGSASRARRRAAHRLFGATLAMALGLFWIAVDIGSGYVRALGSLQPAAQAGRERGGDLVGRSRSARAQRAGAINGLANRWPRPREYPHPVQVRIVKGGPVNAFTLPGGILVFYSDLIDKARDGNEAGGRAGARDRATSRTSCDQGSGPPSTA
jgi:hypothetical protein